MNAFLFFLFYSLFNFSCFFILKLLIFIIKIFNSHIQFSDSCIYIFSSCLILSKVPQFLNILKHLQFGKKKQSSYQNPFNMEQLKRAITKILIWDLGIPVMYIMNLIKPEI